MESNQRGILAPKKKPLTTDLPTTFCATGTCMDEQVKQLFQAQNLVIEGSGKNAVIAAGAAAIVAAVPTFAVLGPKAASSSAESALSYAKLKLDLKTTQAAK